MGAGSAGAATMLARRACSAYPGQPARDLSRRSSGTAKGPAMTHLAQGRVQPAAGRPPPGGALPPFPSPRCSAADTLRPRPLASRTCTRVAFACKRLWRRWHRCCWAGWRGEGYPHGALQICCLLACERGTGHEVPARADALHALAHAGKVGHRARSEPQHAVPAKLAAAVHVLLVGVPAGEHLRDCVGPRRARHRQPGAAAAPLGQAQLLLVLHARVHLAQVQAAILPLGPLRRPRYQAGVSAEGGLVMVTIW